MNIIGNTIIDNLYFFELKRQEIGVTEFFNETLSSR